MYEDTEKFLLTDVQEIHVIELPKMLDKWLAGDINPRQDSLTKWLMMLEATEDEEIAKELEVMAVSDTVLRKAIGEWDRLSQDKEARARYQSRLKGEMDYFSGLKSAERKGRAEGRSEGRAEGKAEAKQDAICLFMTMRFKAAPPDLQQKVRQIPDPEVLDKILAELYAADSLEEAHNIIWEGISKSL